MKKLYDTTTQQIKDYPRADDAPVIGLDPRYVVLNVIETPPPEIAANETAVRIADLIDLNAGTLTWAWRIDTLPPAPDYKIWPTIQQFMECFTMSEKAALGLSTDPTIAALRIDASTWLTPVHANDSRVVMGLDKMVELGIISADRKTEIITI